MECLLNRFTIKKECCCCMPLRVGTLIILWMWIYFSSLTVVSLLIAWVNSSVASDRRLKSKIIDNETISDLRSNVYFKIIVLCILCYIFVLQLCPHISAIYGICKEKPSYLEPCIFVKVAEFVFSITSLIILILALFVVSANTCRLTLETATDDISTVMFWSGVLILIYIVINYHCSSVLYSYYLEMKAIKRNSNQMTPEYSAVLSRGDPLLLNRLDSLPTKKQLFVCEETCK